MTNHRSILFAPTRLLLLALCLVCATANAKVDPKGKSAEYYEDAVKRYNSEDYDGAIVQLKNALQQDPKMLAAHVLMGRIHVDAGAGEAAQTALEEALALGADRSLTAVPLAEAFVIQFKQDQLLDRPVAADLPKPVQIELYLIRARAALEIDNRTALLEALEALEKLAPESLGLLNLKTAIALRDNEIATAATLVEQGLAKAPNDPEVMLAKASITHARGELATALAEYSKLIQISPKNIDARLARVGILLDLNRHTETKGDFEYLAKIRPMDPKISYLRAVAEARAGNDDAAHALLTDATNVLIAMGATIVDRNPSLLLVSGMCQFSLGNFQGAELPLTAYVRMMPNEIGPRKVLATVLMHKNEHEKAAKILKNAVDAFPNEPELLVLLANAYQGAGQHRKAEPLLERALAMKGNDQALAAKLAANRAYTGNVSRAIVELSEVFEHADNLPAAGTPLVILYLQDNKFADAKRIAEKLLEHHPDDQTYLNALALAEIGLGNLTAARALFDKILAKNPKDFSSAVNLSKIDVRENKLDAARTRLEALKKVFPQSSEILLELARVGVASNDPKAATKWAREAYRLEPTSFENAAFLIDRLIVGGKPEEALNIAREEEGRYPNNLFVMEKHCLARTKTKMRAQF
jgi:cellulose synthase operon protein C